MFEIPYSDWPNGRPVQGTWTLHEGTVMVSCPGCKRMGMLDHEIRTDGTLDASLECSHSCGFHEMVKLLDWPKEG